MLYYTKHRGASHSGASRLQAPPVVLVHGAGGDLMHWPGSLRRLPSHDVYALDLPGHGRSEGRGCRDIGAYAEVVREFADQIGLSLFVLGGHSMGGAIALEFAQRYAARLAGLLLVGTGARLPVAPQILNGIRDDFPATIALLAEWAHGERVDPNLHRAYVRRLREVIPEVLYGDFLACDAFDRRDDLASIAVPALILCGSADRMTPASNSRFLAERMPDAQLRIIPGAGHMIMLEQPALVADAVAGFLDRLPAAG